MSGILVWLFQALSSMGKSKSNVDEPFMKRSCVIWIPCSRDITRDR